jgi:penicillin amidase
VHETLGKSGVSVIEAIFNRTGFPASGSSAHVNAIGWDAAEGFEVTWLPSMRMVVDLSDLGRSVAIHTTGQSGHPGHRHYDDLIELWAGGRYLPMRWDRQAVETDAEGTLVLR